MLPPSALFTVDSFPLYQMACTAKCFFKRNTLKICRIDQIFFKFPNKEHLKKCSQKCIFLLIKSIIMKVVNMHFLSDTAVRQVELVQIQQHIYTFDNKINWDWLLKFDFKLSKQLLWRWLTTYLLLELVVRVKSVCINPIKCISSNFLTIYHIKTLPKNTNTATHFYIW